MQRSDQTLRLFLACNGLGHVRRGYEAFFASLFPVLQGARRLEVTLFKGGGPRLLGQRVLWNLPWEGWLARHIGAWSSLGDPIPGRGYFVEQLSFFCRFLPSVVVGRPDIIYFSDKNLGDFLWRWRR